MSSTEPEFRVSVDGAFDEAGTWVIDTEVTFPAGLGATERERLVGEARLGLLMGIAQEAQRGKALGASKVRVHLDDPLRRIFKEVPNDLMRL